MSPVLFVEPIIFTLNTVQLNAFILFIRDFDVAKHENPRNRPSDPPTDPTMSAKSRTWIILGINVIEC